MFEIINLILTSILLALVGFGAWKLYPLLQFALGLAEVTEGSIADHASKGGLSSVAKKGEKILLGDIIRRTLGDATGGMSDIALSLIPDLDDWLDRNPYAVLRLFQNPQVQNIIKQAVTSLQQSDRSGAYGTTEEATW